MESSQACQANAAILASCFDTLFSARSCLGSHPPGGLRALSLQAAVLLAMPGSSSGQSSRASASSICSGKRGLGVVSADPITIDGKLFMRVRQCPLSGVKNTDPNVVRSGRWGPDHSEFALWQRGTSFNPDSRFERISVLAWQLGGFADAEPDIDKFVEKVKVDKSLRARYNGAYKEMITVVEEGIIRFRGQAKSNAVLRVDSAGKKSLSEYQRSEVNLKKRFRACFREVYEMQYPGRIEANKMQVVRMPHKGVPRDFVLVPKDPEGWFDLDETDVQGMELSSIIDDGTAVLTESQLTDKYKAIVDK